LVASHRDQNPNDGLNHSPGSGHRRRLAAVCVSRFFPQIGAAVKQLFRSTVRGAYKMGHKTHEIVAEAEEQVYDIVAEVDAERNIDETASKWRRPTKSLT
jgi:hypothetical protein